MYNLKNKKVILYGTGSLSKQITTLLEAEYNCRVAYYLDTNIRNIEEDIYPPTKILDENLDDCVIIVASSFYNEIFEILKSLDIKEDMIINGMEFVIFNKKVSHSQQGEDLILRMLFDKLGKGNPTYLDIGANDPKFINNTFYFYKFGGSGVCVDPNIKFKEHYEKYRARDKFVNKAVSNTSNEYIDFYNVNKDGLSTLNADEINKYHKLNLDIEVTKERVKTITYNELISMYFENHGPDLLSLDVENFEMNILSCIDFERYAPLVICVETLIFGTFNKNNEVMKYLQDKGYSIYADTFVNTIFVKEEAKSLLI